MAVQSGQLVIVATELFLAVAKELALSSLGRV